MRKENPTLERISPDILDPRNLIKVWRGETDMFSLSPLGVYFIWKEHESRYKFVSNFANGLTADVACGTGYGSGILKDQNNNAQYIGMDINESAVRKTKSALGHSGYVIKANADLAFPFHNQALDTIVSFETIEHLSNIDNFFREARRVLKPNGQLIISTPNREVFSPKKSHSDKPVNRYHVQEYNLSELDAIIRSHFSKIDYYSQGQLTQEEIQNPSSLRARLNRIFGMISGMQTQVVSLNQKIPRYFIAVCQHETEVSS